LCLNIGGHRHSQTCRSIVVYVETNNHPHPTNADEVSRHTLLAQEQSPSDVRIVNDLVMGIFFRSLAIRDRT
jgi:hypothetical protein